MSTEQFVALITAIAVLIGAVTALLRQVQSTHALVNSRMTELLETSRVAATALGRLQGQADAAPAKETTTPTTAS